MILFSFYISSSFAIDCELMRPLHSYRPKETKSFSIDYYSGFKILKRGKDQLLLKNKNSSLGCTTKLFQIEIPVKKIILTSTTQLPALEFLGLESTLIGFQGKKYIYSSRFLQNKISDVSFPLNAEELLKLKPDLVMVYDLNLTTKNPCPTIAKSDGFSVGK